MIAGAGRRNISKSSRRKAGPPTGRRPRQEPYTITGNDGIVFTRSLGGGRGFEAPITLAPATAAQAATLPVTAIGPDGTLCVLYVLLIASADGARTWSPPLTLARAPAGISPFTCNPRSRSFDPRQAVGTGSTRRLGTYQALTAEHDVFHPMWTDTRTGDTQIFTASITNAAC
ncbi:hypothetical protein KGA66_07870 [Actinocrinis puniceicyclus]|uniref:Exo-alpha-sialidase n=1 Tax=Actinocrinis puniceicyclus TaxID=977794 RepID=A0A8J7WIJ0_9ACTN|nr:hypothetical protein [Actinocrinis puniceicyclus]MBS2962956.1 hypothetical protein [Actinocrinis puniceicyclus]